jgi:hypothetical protein
MLSKEKQLKIQQLLRKKVVARWEVKEPRAPLTTAIANQYSDTLDDLIEDSDFEDNIEMVRLS